MINKNLKKEIERNGVISCPYVYSAPFYVINKTFRILNKEEIKEVDSNRDMFEKGEWFDDGTILDNNGHKFRLYGQVLLLKKAGFGKLKFW